MVENVAAVAHLVVESQFGKRAIRIPVYPGQNVIGRHHLEEHDFISGRHIIIECDKVDSFWVMDLNSTNGSYFGENSVIPLRPDRYYQFKLGDSIKLGRVAATLEPVSTFHPPIHMLMGKENTVKLNSRDEDETQSMVTKVMADTTAMKSPTFPSSKRLSTSSIKVDRQPSPMPIDEPQQLPEVEEEAQHMGSVEMNMDEEKSRQPRAITSPSIAETRPSTRTSDSTSTSDNKVSNSKHNRMDGTDIMPENVSRFEPSKARVLFTGLNATQMKRATEILNKYGVETASAWNDATLLLTDRVKRTTKFLCSLASSKQLVSIEWINECRKKKKLLNPDDYPIEDKDAEKKWNFSLSESVSRAFRHQVLKGFTFFATPCIEFDFFELKQVIEACGGKLLSELPSSGKTNVTIVSCPADAELVKMYKEAGCTRFVTTEFITMAALVQQADLDKYALNDGKSRGGASRKRKMK